MVLAVIAQRLRHFDVVLFHQITHEIAMALWNAVSDGADCDIAFALGRYILWNQNIDPVPFAVAMFIKPFQLAFELMRTEAVAPSTPNPPALLTAATTSRQWLNATNGKSIPSISRIRDFIRSSSTQGLGQANNLLLTVFGPRLDSFSRKMLLKA